MRVEADAVGLNRRFLTTSSCMVRRSLVQTATVAYVRRLVMEGRWVLAKRVDLDVAMSFQA